MDNMEQYLITKTNEILNAYEMKNNLTKEDIKSLSNQVDELGDIGKDFDVKLSEQQKQEIVDRMDKIKEHAGLVDKEIEETSSISTAANGTKNPEYQDDEFEKSYEKSNLLTGLVDKFKTFKSVKLIRKSKAREAKFQRLNGISNQQIDIANKDDAILAAINGESGKMKLTKKQIAGRAVGILAVVSVLGVGGISIYKHALAKGFAQGIEQALDDLKDTVPNKANEIAKAKVEAEVIKEKILPENLAFDINDNTTLVNNMSEFSSKSLKTGLPIKEFLTEEQIDNVTKSRMNSVISLDDLYYYTLFQNIENMDPSDFARLQINSNYESWIRNYDVVSTELRYDLLTAKPGDIDFSLLIADKESVKFVQQAYDMIAELNQLSEQSEIKEQVDNIHEFYRAHYITTGDTAIITAAAREQVARFAMSAQQIAAIKLGSNNAIFGKDEEKIIYEDELYPCNYNGEITKSARADEYTSQQAPGQVLYIASLNFKNQDLVSITLEEQKTWVEIKEDIIEKTNQLGIEYHQNEEFMSEIVDKLKSTTSVKSKEGTTTDGKASTVKGDNGLPIAQSELDANKIDSSSPTAKEDYEASVKGTTEQENLNNAVIKDAVTGEVVEIGPNGIQNTKDLFYKGKNDALEGKKASSTDSRYLKGYEAGLKEKEEKENSIPENKVEHIDVPDIIVDTTTTNETTNDYTNDDHANDTNTDITTSGAIESTTNFVPIENSTENSAENSTEESFEDYTGDSQNIESSEESQPEVQSAEPMEGVVVETQSVTMPENQSQRKVEVQTLTRRNDDLKNKYIDIKNMLNSINNTLDETLNNGKSK